MWWSAAVINRGNLGDDNYLARLVRVDADGEALFFQKFLKFCCLPGG